MTASLHQKSYPMDMDNVIQRAHYLWLCYEPAIFPAGFMDLQ